MPLGSALKSTIDIDFTRAQGINSSGSIIFAPPRTRVGTTVISPQKVRAHLVAGVATIELVRLPAGTYHVREEIDGQAPYEFNFALPIGAAATIQYEDLAPVDPVPLTYTSVRTINGLPPDPTTGNIVVTVEGSISLDALSDAVIASPANGQALVYDGVDSRWENRSLTAGDVGAAATGHAHSIGNVTGLTEALDAKSGIGHLHTVSQITDFETAVEIIAELISEEAAAERALPNRIIRVIDKTKEGAGNTYDLPSTSDVWALFAAGPAECTIQANVGDDISVYYDFLIQTHVSSFFDFAVVTGGTPTVQRYLSSGSSTPTFNGPSGSYPSNEGFQGIKGSLGFTVQSADLDAGFVRLRWAIKTSTANGKIYANNNYPLTVNVVNTRLSGL